MFSMLLVLCTTAQEVKIFKIKAGEVVGEVLKPEDIYRYPKFAPGTVVFKSGETASGLMNYNYLEGEINFVDVKGDTLALANAENIKLLTINKDSFYYYQGYLLALYNSKNFTLAKRQVIRLARADKAGAFDQSMPSASQSFGGFQSDFRMARYTVRENLTLALYTDYFIGDRFGKFTALNKKSLLKYTDNEKAVSEFLKSNDINFSKEDDLKKVIQFLQTL